MNQYQQCEKKLINSINAKIELHQMQIGKHLINYATCGSGPPLVLIHGANIGWIQWYLNIPELSRHFTIYALDLPGAGGSSKIDFRSSDLVKNFVNVVDQFVTFNKLENAALLGHSLGGWIILKLELMKRPYIKKIILVDSLGFSDYVPPQHRICAFYPAAKLLCMTVFNPTIDKMKKFTRDVMCRKAADISSEFLECLCSAIRQGKNSHPLLLINRLTNFRKMKKELLLGGELTKICSQTLIIMGDKDPIIPISKVIHMLRIIPNSQLKIFQNVGHLPFLESKEEFNKGVIDFLKS